MFFERKGGLYIGQFAQLFRDPVVFHGCSTRKGGVSSVPYDSLNLGKNTDDDRDRLIVNRRRFYRSIAISEEDVAIPQQIHGDCVIHVDSPGQYPDTDGLITRTPGIALVIQVADCLPIFFHDPNREIIGLVHAGWRGTHLNIVSKAVSHMHQCFGTEPRDVLAFLGPSIGPCCYEVGEEVISHFSSKYIAEGRLDLWRCNKDQLNDAGLLSDRVSISCLCTVCHQEWFYSHRASGSRTGRMMAVMGLKKKALDIEK